MAMTLVETIELDSAAASIEFTSIPQTGVDLLVLVSARSNRSANVTAISRLAINGDEVGTNINLVGDGTTVTSGTAAVLNAGSFTAASATASTFNNTSIYIANYTSTNAKTISSDSVTENDATEVRTRLDANLSNDTAAVTSLEISSPTGNNLVQYSSISLYIIS